MLPNLDNLIMVAQDNVEAVLVDPMCDNNRAHNFHISAAFGSWCIESSATSGKGLSLKTTNSCATPIYIPHLQPDPSKDASYNMLFVGQRNVCTLGRLGPSYISKLVYVQPN